MLLMCSFSSKLAQILRVFGRLHKPNLCGIKSGFTYDEEPAMPTKPAIALSADKEEI